MSEKKIELDASKIEVDGTSDLKYVEVDGIRIRLATPMELNFKWVGNRRLIDQMKACWFTAGDDEQPMNPRLVGKPGVGKTVLAYAVGKATGREVYFFQATSDTTPNDVLINPVVIETGKDTSKIEYLASPLITAMIVGGCCVFDEGNRMQEKAWAALAPLLDSRRYIESSTVGLIIKAHPNFRFVCTMNDDASCFELPEYIKSRLQPTITIDNPDRSEERRILESNLPKTNPIILDYVADFLNLAHKADERYTVREGIHIANYAGKMVAYEEESGRHIDPADAVTMAVEQILGVRQTRYIKRVKWQEEEEEAA